MDVIVRGRTMLTFILVDYKSAEATIKCVSHYVEKCQNAKQQISFVVVDNSVDEENFKNLSSAWEQVSKSEYEGSVLEEKKIAGRRLFLWKNTSNAGYAKGNNAGAKIAAEFLDSDYFVFSNNDLLVLDSELSLDLLVQEASLPQVAAIGPSIVGKKSESQNPYCEKSFFLRWGLEYLCYPFSSCLPKKWKSGDLIEKFEKNPVFRVMGSFLLIARKKFEEVDGFDPNTFLFAEEMILSKKLQARGYETHFVPSVHLLHNHSEIIGKKYDYSRKLMLRFESEAYYYRTYAGVGPLQIAVVRLILKSYIIRKKIAKMLKSLIK